MKQITKLLKGKKTYFLVALGALVWASQVLGYITPELEAQLYQLLGVSAVGTLRSAIK